MIIIHAYISNCLRLSSFGSKEAISKNTSLDCVVSPKERKNASENSRALNCPLWNLHHAIGGLNYYSSQKEFTHNPELCLKLAN